MDANGMPGVTGPIDLFSTIGINVEREQLYTGAIATIGDSRNGLYFALRTVDKDSRAKRWDVYVIYVASGGAVKLAYWFKQGQADLPYAAGGVALALRSDGKVILTITADAVPGALFPPKVFILEPIG